MAAKILEDDANKRENRAVYEFPASRTVRQAAQRNVAERLAQLEQERNIDSQRKQSQAQLERDQKQLRAQLRRLQDEQRLLAEDDRALLYSMAEVFDGKEEDCTFVEEEDEEWRGECVNPYPIVFPSTVQSKSTTAGNSGKRRDNTDPEEESEGQGRILAKFRSPRSSVSGDALPGEESVWLGDPEAIHSVRRPRKSVARMQLDHSWTRSHSWKEKAVSKSESCRRSDVTRSRSMKETRADSLRESRRAKEYPGQSGLTSLEARCRRMRIGSNSSSKSAAPDLVSARPAPIGDTPPEVQSGQKRKSGRRVSLSLSTNKATPDDVTTSAIDATAPVSDAGIVPEVGDGKSRSDLPVTSVSNQAAADRSDSYPRKKRPSQRGQKLDDERGQEIK